MPRGFQNVTGIQDAGFFGLPAACLVVVGFLLASGCTGSRIAVDDRTGNSQSQPAFETSYVEQRIRDQYVRWRGTPHVLGGSSARGMDCSAFVQRVFDDAFDVRLPRTTGAQVRSGRRISQTDLQPGDLVFFKPGKTQHVGIYLNDGEFAHVSSSSGVTVSHIDQAYWSDAYWTSRRILPTSASSSDRTVSHASEQGPPVEGGVSTSTAGAPSARVGW